MNLETCVKCFSSHYMIEMRDAHLPAPRNAFGEWRVCVNCGHEWPVQRPNLPQLIAMGR